MKRFLPFFILILSVAFHSCQNKNSAEAKEIELLQNQLGENAKTLQIDIAIFEDRVLEINENLDLLSHKLLDTVSLELGLQFDKYKAMRKIYEYNIKTFNACTNEQMELETQLTNLLKDVKEGTLSKQEFKQFYSVEKADALALIEKSNGIKTKLYEVEPEFKRLSDLVYSYIDKINL